MIMFAVNLDERGGECTVLNSLVACLDTILHNET
jgi:hypothetical protein